MTKLEAIEEARRVIAETTISLSYVTNTELRLWVNEGVKDMSIKGRIYEKAKTIAVVNGTASYTLPWDFLEPKAFITVGGGNLLFIEQNMIGSVYLVTGKPIHFTLFQGTNSPAVRANLTVYATGTLLISSSTSLKHVYEVTTGGTSGVSVPTYPTGIGERVDDGSCVLTTWEYSPKIFTATLYDTPSVTYAGNYILNYYAMAQGVGYNDDPLPFLPEWHHTLVKYLCFKWAVKAKNISLAKGFYTDYASSLGVEQEESTKGTD